jgi:DNA-binding transcriptional ArsR family regulator
MELLGSAISAGDAAPDADADADAEERGRRRVRRPIRELILRELSFSGQAMTATQIAKAIDYHPERTETALERLEETGQVLRNAGGRWAIGNTTVVQLNGHAATGDNGKSRSIPDAVGGSM